LFGDTRGSSVRTAFIIVADAVAIVNAAIMPLPKGPWPGRSLTSPEERLRSR